MFRVHHRRCGLRTGPFTTGRASSFPVKFGHGPRGPVVQCSTGSLAPFRGGRALAWLESHSGKITSFSGADRLG